MGKYWKPLCCIGIIVVIGLIKVFNEPSPQPTQPAKPPKEMRPPRSEQPPKGRAGPLMLFEPKAKVKVWVWFPQGCDGHEETLRLLFRTYARSEGRMEMIGLFGLRNQDDETIARSRSDWRPDEVVKVNDKEEFVIRDSSGKSRRVHLAGWEGRDYRPSDVELVLRDAFAQAYPGYKLDLSDRHLEVKDVKAP